MKLSAYRNEQKCIALIALCWKAGFALGGMEKLQHFPKHKNNYEFNDFLFMLIIEIPRVTTRIIASRHFRVKISAIMKIIYK